jgi:hypothetical protein
MLSQINTGLVMLFLLVSFLYWGVCFDKYNIQKRLYILYNGAGVDRNIDPVEGLITEITHKKRYSYDVLVLSFSINSKTYNQIIYDEDTKGFPKYSIGDKEKFLLDEIIILTPYRFQLPIVSIFNDSLQKHYNLNTNKG